MEAMTTTSPRDYTRLAEIARARRLELGLSIVAAAETAGVAKDTYRRIESGMPVRDTTYAKLDEILGWAVGSSLGILDADAEPTLADDEQRQTVYTEVPKRILEDEDIAQAVTSAVVASTDALTIAQVREITTLAVAELKRRGLLPED